MVWAVRKGSVELIKLSKLLSIGILLYIYLHISSITCSNTRRYFLDLYDEYHNGKFPEAGTNQGCGNETLQLLQGFSRIHAWSGHDFR